MSKEWILNNATNRFQLNFKRNVGAVAEAIRACEPKDIEQWKEYYYENVRSEEHLIELGKKLYIKVSEVLTAEIEQITEEDCINYIKNLIINRTYDGYTTEIETIYGQLQNILGVSIEPAPDKWDRLYNVDFYIKIKDKYIGIQIKPVSNVTAISEIYKERKIQQNSHLKFTKEFGGKVFYIFSHKENGKKVIANREVIEDIKEQIKILSK